MDKELAKNHFCCPCYDHDPKDKGRARYYHARRRTIMLYGVTIDVDDLPTPTPTTGAGQFELISLVRHVRESTEGSAGIRRKLSVGFGIRNGMKEETHSKLKSRGQF